MAHQEEQSLKRKSGQVPTNGAPNGPPKSRIRAVQDQKPRSSIPQEYRSRRYGENTRTRQADAPPPSPTEQPLDRATASTTGSILLHYQTFDSSKCAGCGSSSHRLNICMKVDNFGSLMRGCPWCNTTEHSVANCPEAKDDLAMQLEVIQMRANMPSFQPTQDWVEGVRVAVANGHSPPSSFPWTSQFTETLRSSLSLYQRGLDRVGVNNRKGLPIHPDTKDWETVQRKFPPFEGY
ncbi:hypothetical protein FPRO05_02374 [Fusarium proliferatum]|uniref:CCHC-type domain-containing protein n=1 Tax=Gibberella intermedia TaxID=948311 RepID=A0A365MYE9_GIBIN|nr:hypothetical protein FPRO05_02374 [Fusarium proliferatum]